MMEFFSMGGYGAYVWSSFLLTFLVLIANVVAARMKYRHTLKSIKGQIKREQRSKQR